MRHCGTWQRVSRVMNQPIHHRANEKLPLSGARILVPHNTKLVQRPRQLSLVIRRRLIEVV